MIGLLPFSSLKGTIMSTLITLCLRKSPRLGRSPVLIVYVDDIVLSGDDAVEIIQLKKKMGNEFEIKDLENLKYFLGIEVAGSKDGISVSQRKYT